MQLYAGANKWRIFSVINISRLLVRKFAAKYLSTFFRPRKTGLRRGTKKRNQQFCALDFEQLEHRRVLASFGFAPQFGVDVTSDIVYRDDAQVGHGTPQAPCSMACRAWLVGRNAYGCAARLFLAA